MFIRKDDLYMSREQNKLSASSLEELQTTGAGYDILRYVSLPDLLGEEAPSLLYFMGKNLARKMDIETMSDVAYIFEQLGWGRLEMIKEKRKELVFTLLSDAVVQRLKAPIETEFRLEAGFLAESIQLIKEVECECTEDINHKIHQIEFRVIYT